MPPRPYRLSYTAQRLDEAHKRGHPSHNGNCDAASGSQRAVHYAACRWLLVCRCISKVRGVICSGSAASVLTMASACSAASTPPVLERPAPVTQAWEHEPSSASTPPSSGAATASPTGAPPSSAPPSSANLLTAEDEHRTQQEHPAFVACRIRADRGDLSSLTVSAAGQTFSLNVEGVPLELQLEGGNPLARVHVRAPLRFTGSIELSRLDLRVSEQVALHGGRIGLGKGAKAKWLGVRGDELLGSFDKLLGVTTQPPIGVPCRRIELGNGSPYETPDRIVAPSKPTVGTGAALFPLYRLPDEDMDALLLSYRGPLVVGARRPGWVFLTATWADGSSLRGWTRERYARFGFEKHLTYGEGSVVLKGCGRSHEPQPSPIV